MRIYPSAVELVARDGTPYPVFVCPDCGSLVVDREKHDEDHTS
jgi:predicted RNA-binding Zn-ribbon protein involved in translation (DUF1610 family)